MDGCEQMCTLHVVFVLYGGGGGGGRGGMGGILRDAPEYECLYSRPSQAVYYKSLKMIMGVIFVVQVSVFGGF